MHNIVFKSISGLLSQMQTCRIIDQAERAWDPTDASPVPVVSSHTGPSTDWCWVGTSTNLAQSFASVAYGTFATSSVGAQDQCCCWPSSGLLPKFLLLDVKTSRANICTMIKRSTFKKHWSSLCFVSCWMLNFSHSYQE